MARAIIKDVVLRVSTDEYYLIQKLLAEKEQSYDIFKDDTKEGYWMPKHKLGVLAMKLGDQFSKLRKVVAERED